MAALLPQSGVRREARLEVRERGFSAKNLYRATDEFPQITN
jgi:hypothetical protein